MSELRKLINPVIQQLQNERIKMFTRMVRELSTVDNMNNRVKANIYTRNIMQEYDKSINEFIGLHRNTLAEKVTYKKPVFKDLQEEQVYLLRREDARKTIESKLKYANDKEVYEMADEYHNTEFADIFKEAAINKYKTEANGNKIIENKALEIKNYMENEPYELLQFDAEVSEILRQSEPLKFSSVGNDNFAHSIVETEDGRLLATNGLKVDIKMQINNPTMQYNPTGENLEPLITTKTFGTKYLKTIEYEYEWENI